MTDPKQINVMTAKNTAYAWKASVTRNAGISMNQKRIGALIVALFLSVVPAFAQGTIMPPPIFTGLDSSGNPLVSGKLCTYVAGTSTPATTYTSSALSPGATNTNPVILDAAGRATVFLRPGSSYKFVLYSAGSDQTCNTGTLQWSQDNINAIPTSNVNLDIDGTAGESLGAGDAVYLSDGSGSRTQGSWYKTDSDLTYASSDAPVVGVVPSAIASGSTGTIRLNGLVTVTGPLAPAAVYYASGTAGSFSSTVPANVRQVGLGYTSTSILVGVQRVISQPTIPCGRPTLTSNVPVTTSDVTAATTVYYTPYGGCNTISYFNGTTWQKTSFTQASIAVPATTNTMYDIFAYNNAGTTTLELVAWTNDTTRATALATQDGAYVKTGDLTRLYLGSFRTTGVSGQTEDSAAKRYLWSYYHRVMRQLQKSDTTASWSYATATIRQVQASAANQVEVVIGAQEDLVIASYSVSANSGAAGVEVFRAGLGVDSTTAFATSQNGMQGASSGQQGVGATPLTPQVTTYLAYPMPVGRHTITMLESGGGTSTTWFGNTASTTGSAVLVGWVKG